MELWVQLERFTVLWLCAVELQCVCVIFYMQLIVNTSKLILVKRSNLLNWNLNKTKIQEKTKNYIYKTDWILLNFHYKSVFLFINENAPQPNRSIVFLLNSKLQYQPSFFKYDNKYKYKRITIFKTILRQEQKHN